MILDTSVWVHFTNKDGVLSQESIALIYSDATHGLYVCTISCWEIAKLVEKGRLDLDVSVGVWIRRAIADTGCKFFNLEPEIVELSTQLPGVFGSNDPADQIIIATGIMKNMIVATNDDDMLDYPHADTLDCR